MKYILLILSALLLLTGCSTKQQYQPLIHKVECTNNVYALKSAECLKRNDFITKLEQYPVIFMGDNHGSDVVHSFISDTITKLSERGYRIHLANEWFTPDDNDLLARYSAKEFDDTIFIKKFRWKKRLNSKFESFAPIYHAIRDNNGILYGINISKKEQKKISNVDKRSMSHDEKRFFYSLDLDISAHNQFLSPFFSTCHTRKQGETQEECIKRAYRVQVAWEAKMGRESAKLAKRVLKTPKDKLIVFLGAMHMVYGLGANLRFGRESDLLYANVVPQVWNLNYVEHASADFVYLHEKNAKIK